MHERITKNWWLDATHAYNQLKVKEKKMSNYNERLDKVLLTYKSAYQIAFREVDPHGNNMSPYDGSKAVSERGRDIETKAKQAIKQLVADEMLALIGDDEDTEKAYAIGFDNGESAHYNNELRQELRTKLAEWLGKGAK